MFKKNKKGDNIKEADKAKSPNEDSTKSQKKRKVLSCALLITAVVVCVGGLAFYAERDKYMFSQASKKLGQENKYTVMTTLTMPDGSVNYIEVNTPDGNYTEYPYNSKGSSNSKDVPKDVSKGNSYIINDWLTNDNKLYEVNTKYSSSAPKSDTNTIWNSLPDEYAKAISGRKTLYSDLLIGGMYEVKKDGVVNKDIGTGEKVDITQYTCKVRGDTVAKLMQKDSYDLYSQMLLTAKQRKDTSMEEWLNTNLVKLKRNLTFSDADMKFGIYDGKLVAWDMEVGGLGSQMTITKQVVFENGETRSLPDFSSCSELYTHVKEFVDSQPSKDKDKTGTDSSQQNNTSKTDSSKVTDATKPSDNSTEASSADNTKQTSKPASADTTKKK